MCSFTRRVRFGWRVRWLRHRLGLRLGHVAVDLAVDWLVDWLVDFVARHGWHSRRLPRGPLLWHNVAPLNCLCKTRGFLLLLRRLFLKGATVALLKVATLLDAYLTPCLGDGGFLFVRQPVGWRGEVLSAEATAHASPERVARCRKRDVPCHAAFLSRQLPHRLSVGGGERQNRLPSPLGKRRPGVAKDGQIGIGGGYCATCCATLSEECRISRGFDWLFPPSRTT